MIDIYDAVIDGHLLPFFTQTWLFDEQFDKEHNLLGPNSL